MGKIDILTLNRDQLRKMQFQGLRLRIEPATFGSPDIQFTDSATETVAVSKFGIYRCMVMPVEYKGILKIILASIKFKFI